MILISKSNSRRLFCEEISEQIPKKYHNVMIIYVIYLKKLKYFFDRNFLSHILLLS